MEAKQQICVRLKKEHLDELEKLSKQHDLPKSWFINQAVKDYIEEMKKRG